MAEFTELPVAAGILPADNLWDELRLAIINRQEMCDEVYGTALDPGSNPTDLSVGDLWRRIVQYRAAIDAMVGYFYIETDLLADTETAYTANTLHNAAFGDNDWDPAGAPNLTPPCLPHKNLWNNMKACLDLMKWVKIDSPNGAMWTGDYYETNESDTVWLTAKQKAFGAIAIAGGHANHRCGRFVHGALHPGSPDFYRIQTVYSGVPVVPVAENNFQTGDLDSMPPTFAIADGMVVVPMMPYDYTDDDHPGPISYEDCQFDLYIEGTKVNNVPFDRDTSENELAFFRMNNVGAIAFNTDDTNNLLELKFLDSLTAVPDNTVWPAPIVYWADGGSVWYEQGAYVAHALTRVYLKFSWD